ncbi:hypothetical protein EV426DRAFT_581900 [Tirmania nivea]|nr:hypothetical protein EV426DRAFT_581900 [Tirmania nivea]
MFLIHHKVEGFAGEFRPPTQCEAAQYFKIPQRTISVWWNARKEIEQMPGGAYRMTNKACKCTWPGMEEKLFKKFVESRQGGRLIRTSWFRRESQQIFANTYPHLDICFFGWMVFRFSTPLGNILSCFDKKGV